MSLFFIVSIIVFILTSSSVVFMYYKLQRTELLGSIDNLKKPLIIFDFDGTICDSYDSMIDSLNSISKEYGLKSVAKKDRLKLKVHGSKVMLNEMGISWFKLPFVVRRMREVLSDKIPNMQKFKGTKVLLQRLKKRGYSVGLLTSNSMKNVQLFLNNHDMTDAFDFVYTGSSIFGKEKHLVSITKGRKLSDKKDFIYVGDETRDIQAAKNAKFYSVGVTWGFNSKLVLQTENPDLLIDSWDELLKGI